MQSRLDFYSASPAAVQAMVAFDQAVKALALEPRLVELVKLRASQLNGCAYCVDLHSRDAKRQGDTDRRLHAVAVWRESPFFTERERAALAWTEALTRLSETHAADADYAWVTEQVKAVAGRHAGGRMVSMLEGGYALSALGRSVVQHVRVLADLNA